MSEYADPVIDWLDEDQTMVSHRYFRQVNGKKSEKGCWWPPLLSSPVYQEKMGITSRTSPWPNLTSQKYVLSTIVLSPMICLKVSNPYPSLQWITKAYGLDNGIPISSWIESPNDESLLDLLPLLDALRFTSDVRSILRLQQFGL